MVFDPRLFAIVHTNTRTKKMLSDLSARQDRGKNMSTSPYPLAHSFIHAVAVANPILYCVMRRFRGQENKEMKTMCLCHSRGWLAGNQDP